MIKKLFNRLNRKSLADLISGFFETYAFKFKATE